MEYPDDKRSWSKYAKEYDPIKIGSIDGTDEIPHDAGIARALNSKYKPNQNVKGKARRTLYVTHLDLRTTQDTIVDKFSKFGKIISCRLIRDIVTGMSKGYAFVEYSDSKAAHGAYEYMNNEYIDSAKILVDYEMERRLPGWKPRRLGGGFGGKRESGQLRFGCRSRPFQELIIIKTNQSHRTSQSNRDSRHHHHGKR